MPVDASIPLQQAQQPNLLQTLGQVYALRNAQQEAKLRDLGIQQTQMQLNDQMALGKAYQHNFQNGQFNQQGFQQDVLQNAPRLYPQIVQQGIEMQKNQLGLQQQQLASAQAHTDYLAKHLQGIAGAPPDQKQTIYSQSRQQMIQDGALKEGGPDDPGPIYPGDDAIGRIMQSTMSVKDAIAAKQKDLEVQTQQLTQQEAARHNTATEQQAQNTLAQTAARDKEMAQYHRGELGVRGAELGIQQQRNNLEATRLNLEFGSGQQAGPLQNEAQEAMAQQIAAGNVKSLPMSSRAPQNRLIMQRAYQINPKLSDATYNTTQSYTNADGEGAFAIKALSTMMSHLEDAKQNSKSLGYTPTLGTAMQHGGTAGAYTQDINFFTQEVGKMIAGKAITEGEGKRLLSGLESAWQGTRDKTLDELTKLAGGRYDALKQAYTTGTGKQFDPTQYFDQKTQQRLSDAGILKGKSAAAATPDSHVFSLGAWQKANPKGDANAAKAAAQQAGYQVVE